MLSLSLSIVVTAACSGGPQKVTAQKPNPLRDRLLQVIAQSSENAPLQLRYNPAACNCPDFEVRVDKQWVRTQWRNGGEPQFAAILKAVRNSPPSQWPVSMLVEGKFEGRVWRTEQGVYSLSLEVSKITGQHAPALQQPPTARQATQETPSDSKEDSGPGKKATNSPPND